MAELTREIEAYEAIRSNLEADHLGEWVVVHDLQVIGFYRSFETAARNAVAKFGRGPFLIREVGASPTVLPASVLYVPSA